MRRPLLAGKICESRLLHADKFQVGYPGGMPPPGPVIEVGERAVASPGVAYFVPESRILHRDSSPLLLARSNQCWNNRDVDLSLKRVYVSCMGSGLPCCHSVVSVVYESVFLDSAEECKFRASESSQLLAFAVAGILLHLRVK